MLQRRKIEKNRIISQEIVRQVLKYIRALEENMGIPD